MSATPATAEDTCRKNHSRNGQAPSEPSSAAGAPGDEGVSASEQQQRLQNHHPPEATDQKQQQPPQATVHQQQQHSSAERFDDSAPSDSDIVFPEGGLAAWLVVFGSFCAMGAVFGVINSTAVFESYFKANQLRDYSHSAIGWIFSVYLFLVFFVGIQVGPVFDRHGPRLLLAGGSACVVSSLMLLSVSSQYYQIMLSYSVLGGIGGAMLNAPAYGAIAHYFDVRRGLATGIATTAGGVGGIVFPLLLQFLLGDDGVGFGWSCRILGFILLGLCALANVFIRTRLTPGADDEGGVEKKGSVWPDFAIFGDRRFALAAVGVFFMEYGLFVPLTYIVSYATSHGFDASDASILLSLLNAGSVLGRFLPGLLADIMGRFNVIIMTISLCAATVLGLWLPSAESRPMLIAFCVSFGFASGSNLGLVPVCLGQFCSPRDFGRYYTTAQMVASFGTLSSVPVGGALLGLGGDTGWLALIVFSGLTYVVALVCYTMARVFAVGWQPWKKF